MKKPRQKDDFYSTPPAVIDAILPHLPIGGSILEPAAGDGAILQRLWAKGVDFQDVNAIEIDEQRARSCVFGQAFSCIAADALKCVWPSVDLVITNPPFRHGLAFVRKALEATSERGGTVAMLLRLTFLESKKRTAFHRDYPADVYILPTRPKYVHGKSDTVTSAWFVWGRGRGGHWGILDVKGDK